MKQIDLTKGRIIPGIIRFSIPLMIGNVLQQCYNIVDTLVVGRFVGKEALAAVGSAYTLMVFLTSVLLGLSMGAGTFLSIQYGRKEKEIFHRSNQMSFVLIGICAALLTVIVYVFMNPILAFLQVPAAVMTPIRTYLNIIYSGLIAVFIYNYFASTLRAIGNSFVPLLFLALSSVLNIILDFLLVAVFPYGIAGAAIATVISQYVSAIGILVYVHVRAPALRLHLWHLSFRKELFKPIFSLAFLTSLQQSIMNFGILMVQGRVNYFGTAVMAAFAAGVKVDTLAYSPVQDFGNAFSTFVAQNYGSHQPRRIDKGYRFSALAVLAFCSMISLLVVIFAPYLIGIFTADREIIGIGTTYLRMEGIFYALIGFLFLFYGYFRAIAAPGVSVILTIVSLGTRVILAYGLSMTRLGYYGIWMSIPIGWALADGLGLIFLKIKGKKEYV